MAALLTDPAEWDSAAAIRCDDPDAQQGGRTSPTVAGCGMGLVGSAWRWIVSVAPRSPWALAPGLHELRGYRRDQLRPDLLAGVTGAAVAVPAGLAMGELAGLSPVAGLYATMLPLVAYALFTSSRHVMVGPDGTLAVLTATTVAPLAGGNTARYAALAAALALMVGLILLVSAALRLGFMADFLSIPILIGYFNGIALIIIASQLGKVFGLSISADLLLRGAARVRRRGGPDPLVDGDVQPGPASAGTRAQASRPHVPRESASGRRRGRRLRNPRLAGPWGGRRRRHHRRAAVVDGP